MTSPSALEYGIPYHIFTRGINRENIFFEERNYFRFMELFCYHVAPIADTYAYCLLGNHFHLFLRIKNRVEIVKSRPNSVGNKKRSFPIPGQCFGNLLNAYAKSINYSYHRTGSLFQHPFGRIPVLSDRYYEQLMKYIHHNPQHHGFVKDFREWPFSSFHTLQSREDVEPNGSIFLTRINEQQKSTQSRLRASDQARFQPLVVSDFF